MKKRLISLTFQMLMIVSLFWAVTASVNADTAPTAMWIEPSEASGVPAQIDLFEPASDSATDSVHTYQLYLPGDANPANCFLSWDGDMQATADGVTYTSGTCPIPPVDTEETYTFESGGETLATFNVTTYQGSSGVMPIFIDIDESKGTIEAMDSDSLHETTCSGKIYIDGAWQEMPKIKGRGNYTWRVAEDKRAYNITLGSKTTISGIDSEPTKKWSILAEIVDHSLLRNRVGFSLAHELGVGQDTESADVWMNGEYQGCYTLTPKYDSFVTKNGYMVEQDNYQETLSVDDGGDPQFALEGLICTNSTDVNLITVKKIGDNLLKKDGEVDESAANQIAVADTIRVWLQDAWDAIRSEGGYNSKGKYYTDYIDIESFAETYLMHEYVKSYDICSGSILFHRDGTNDDDKLIAGPIWDLDNSLGTCQRNYGLGIAGDLRSGRGAFISEITEYKTSIYKALSRHEDFMAEVQNQYETHAAAFENLGDTVDQMSAQIEASARMNHIKVNDISHCNVHKYGEEIVLEEGTVYEQRQLATTDSKSDWANYIANLKTFIAARSLWFSNTCLGPCSHGQGTTVTTTKATLKTEGAVTKYCDICGRSLETEIIYVPKTYKLAKTRYTYDNKAKKPAVTVTDSSGEVISAKHYNITYSDNVDAGKATVTVDFKGDRYSGSKSVTFTIQKAANTLKVRAKTATVKYKKVKKKKQTLAASKVIKFTKKGQGPKIYKKVSGNKKITIDQSTGKVTVKKNTKIGTYNVKVKVKATGNDNYNASSWKTVTCRIKVK